MEYSVNLDHVKYNAYEVVGAFFIENACHTGRPVIITKSRGVDVFSGQCECGFWCTTGCKTIDGVMKEWQKMTDHYKAEVEELQKEGKTVRRPWETEEN